ncbi:hypothetical protein GVX86_07650 [[Haemophilus] felis]|nr:hypothetical protein [[Haemophilus] felis]
MKLLKTWIYIITLLYLPQVWSITDINIKYSSNYLMPAYVHFQAEGKRYKVAASINVPFYKIQFSSQGEQTTNYFKMEDYLDTRNGKPYALSKIRHQQVEYGKVQNGLSKQDVNIPIFDLFSLAFQLAYYDKLPLNFMITNGKKLYKMENVVVNKSTRKLPNSGQEQMEISYRFKTEDNKEIVVKKIAGEGFPRYISYSRDGDDYELTFKEFVK